MINGENAAYKSPKFLKPQIRTRNALIDDIITEYGKFDLNDVKSSLADIPSELEKSSSNIDFIEKLGTPDVRRKFSFKEKIGIDRDTLGDTTEVLTSGVSEEKIFSSKKSLKRNKLKIKTNVETHHGIIHNFLIVRIIQEWQ